MKTNLIEGFLRTAYSDGSLLALKEAAELGELDPMNCDHCLLGRSDAGYFGHRGRFSLMFTPTEQQFVNLAPHGFRDVVIPKCRTAWKRRISDLMIPLIDAEIDHRASLVMIQVPELEVQQ